MCWRSSGTLAAKRSAVGPHHTVTNRKKAASQRRREAKSTRSPKRAWPWSDLRINSPLRFDEPTDGFESANSTAFTASRVSPGMSRAMIFRTDPGARVHRRDQDEICREGRAVHRLADRDLSLLRRLAEDFERLAVELGHLIEEEAAFVSHRGERRLSEKDLDLA